MSRLFFLLATVMALGFCIPSVFGAPPSIDFNFTPASPRVFETVTFDPNITSSPDLNFLRWGFDTDGNINYETTQGSVLFYDNFNDADISDWVQTSGIWNAAAGYLTANINNSNIYHDVNTTILTGDLNIGFRIYLEAAATSGHLAWNTTANATRTNGYTVQAEENLITLAEDNTTVASFVVTLPILTNHDINISHKTDGNIQVFLNGAFVGSYTDLTYTTGNRVIFGRGDQKRFDNIRVFGSGSAIDLDKNETHVFTTVGTKTVCLTGGNTDGNTTTCKNVEVSGNLTFKVFDENTKLPVANPKAVFQGTTFFGSAGTVSLSTPTVGGEYVVEIYDVNYPSRFYTFYIDINTVSIQSVYLIKETQARDYDFYVIDNNSFTYPNRLLRIMKDGNLVSSRYLDGESFVSGIRLANLTTDYNFFVDVNTGGTTLKDWNNSLVTVLNPINELLLNAVTPWRMIVTDLTSIDRNALTTAKTFSVYPATANAYKLTVDLNALGYFQRFYHFRTRAGEKTYSIQPYVLSLEDGAVQGQFTMTDSVTSLKVERFIVEFYTDVGTQAGVLVESPQTDSAGVFLFSTITGKTYSLRVLNKRGVEVENRQFISSTSSTYFYDLFTGTISPNNPYQGFVDINFVSPSTGVAYRTGANQWSVSVKLRTNNVAVTQAVLQVFQNGSIVATRTYTPTFPAVTFENGQVFDHNFLLADQNAPILTRWTLKSSIGERSFYRTYTLSKSTGPGFQPLSASMLRGVVGEFGMFIIWMGLALVLTSALRFSPNLALDNNGMVFVLIVWALFGGAIELIDPVAAGIGVLGAASYWVLRRQGLG